MCHKTQSLYIMKYNIKLKMITTMTQTISGNFSEWEMIVSFVVVVLNLR